MYGSFDTEKAIHTQARERLTPCLPLNSRVSSLQQQRDFLATVETLPSVAVLQGAIYHLDTVYSVFIVGVRSVFLLFCGGTRTYPCSLIFTNRISFLFLVPHMIAENCVGIVNYPLSSVPIEH